jgi:TolB-like protein
LAATLLAAAATGRAEAQQTRPSFAVLPFENSGSYGQDKDVFEAFELGIPVLLSAALDRHPGADVTEYTKVRSAVSAAGIRDQQRIDAATAAQVARSTGARYTVSGSFADFYGKFRITARVVDAETGQILKVVSNNDPKLQDRGRLSAILAVVADRIAVAAGAPAGTAGGRDIPTAALTDFSLGLLYESRDDRAKALDFYRKASSADPAFEEPRAAARRLEGG